MVDPFLVIVVIVMMIVMFIMNVYLVVHYSHPLESKFWGAIVWKILMVFALLIIEWEILTLPLDVSNTHQNGNLDMKGFWYTVTMTSWCLLFLLLPLAYFFYETEGDQLKSRICQTTWMMSSFIIIWVLIVFLTYPFMNKSDIPIDSVDWNMSLTVNSGVLLSYSSTSTSDSCSLSSTTFKTEISFAVYMIGLLSFIGWWIFVFFLGVGLVAIPMDLINEFRNRPVRIEQGEFNRRRTKLLQHVTKLRKDGKQLESVKETVEKSKGIKGWKNKKVFNRDLNKHEIQWMIAEREFLLLEKITKISKLEPCLYVLKLLIGIFFILWSIVWLIHIILWVIAKSASDYVHPFLNGLLEGIRQINVDFISATIFALLAIYLLFATIKGNVKFGLRFFWITFYPLRPNETFVSSFVFNVWLIQLWTFSLLQFLVRNFSMFARNTDAFKIFQIQVRYAWFFKWFWTSEFFSWFLLFWTCIAFIYLMCKPAERLSLDSKMRNTDVEENKK